MQSFFACLFDHINLSAPKAKTWAFADCIDQDQTAQNVQPDLGSLQSASLVKPTR